MRLCQWKTCNEGILNFNKKFNITQEKERAINLSIVKTFCTSDDE